MHLLKKLIQKRTLVMLVFVPLKSYKNKTNCESGSLKNSIKNLDKEYKIRNMANVLNFFKFTSRKNKKYYKNH